MPYRINVAESTPRTVLELHRTIRAEQAGEDIGIAMTELFEHARRAGLKPTGAPATTYLGRFDLLSEVEIVLTVPVAVGEDCDNTLNREDIRVRESSGGLVASTTHRGDYQHIQSAYRALDRWLQSSPYRQAGPITEVYLIGPRDIADPHLLVTEIRMPVRPDYGLTVRVPTSVETTVEVLTGALAEQGFGVLTDVDVRDTLHREIDVTMEEFRILGVCNPRLAHQALDLDRHLGLLLPCNVVVRRDESDTLVEAVDPDLLMQVTTQPDLRPLAAEVRARLTAVLQATRARALHRADVPELESAR